MGNLADRERLPDTQVEERISGELFVSAGLAVAQTVAASELLGELGRRFGRADWWVFWKPELRLLGDVLVPDLAAWKRDRFTPHARDTQVAVAPDWVAEVLSPSTAQLDRGFKMKAYARAGIPWLWLLDPLARTLEVYQAAPEERWTLLATHVGNAQVAAPPFHAVTLDLAPWWLPDEE